jgi:methylglutaconyl-CoA hydratase
MEPLIRQEADGGLATITLDSAHNRNALSRRLVAELHAALSGALADDAVRVIVLTGAGTVFCAGLDLKEQSAGEPPPDLPGLLRLVWDSPKPVVARLNGPARAGGLGLVAACDIAIAPDTATFAFTEVRLGVAPALISVTCLRRMDPRAAAEYFLTGEVFDARRAERIGLLNRAVPPGELDATVARYTAMLLRGAPEALAVAKRLPRTVPGMSVEEGFERMGALSATLFASDEAREGIAAFLDKRDPRWLP